MARKTLENWIHETLQDRDNHEAPPSRFVLCHLVGQGRTEIHTLKIAEKASYTPKALAEVFHGKADVHCQDVNGESRFVIDAYWKSGSEAEAYFPFVRRGQRENYTGLAHAPNEEGRLSQKMEWETKFLSQIWNRQNQLDLRDERNSERMEREREAFFKQRLELMQENNRSFELLKELYIKTALDTHQQAMAKLEYQRRTSLINKAVDAIPIAANMITGREVFPQSVVDTRILEGIAKALSPEMIQMLAMLDIPDEEKGILMHRINQVQEKVTKEQEHINQLPQSSLTGEEEFLGKGEPH